MVFDYTISGSGENIGQLIDSLSETEKEHVAVYARELKEMSAECKRKQHLDWIMEAIVPSLKYLAQINHAVLETEQEEDTVYAKIRHEKGFEIMGSEYLKHLRLALSTADFVEIRKTDTWVQICMAYSKLEIQNS